MHRELKAIFDPRYLFNPGKIVAPPSQPITWPRLRGRGDLPPSGPFAASVYDALMEAGAVLSVKDAGYYAIESLRLEKGYRAWGRELTPDYNPYEAGLGFAVDLGKGDFLGRAALKSARRRR